MAKGTPGFFDVGRLTSGGIVGQRRRLGAVKALVDFELFRAALETAVPRAERSKGGRPPFDHVLMFKILILQAMLSTAEPKCAKWRRESVPVELREKGREALAS